MTESFLFNHKRFLNIKRENGDIESFFVASVVPQSYRVKNRVINVKAPSPIPPEMNSPLGYDRLNVQKPNSVTNQLIAPLNHNIERLHLFQPLENYVVGGNRFSPIGDESFISIYGVDGNPKRIPARILRIQRDQLSNVGFVDLEVINPLTGKVTQKILPLAELSAARVSRKSKLAFSNHYTANYIFEVDFNGMKLSVEGDNSFISLSVLNDKSRRDPARVYAIKEDPVTKQVFVELEIISNNSGIRRRESLTLESLDGARLSKTSKEVFEGYASQIYSNTTSKKVSKSFGKSNIFHSQNLYKRNMQNPVRLPNGELVYLRRNGYLHNIAREEGRILDDLPISSLERDKSYTFVIASNGEVSFGKVDTAWEIGVKHGNIATRDGVIRNIIAAGEIKVKPNGTILYNLESGTFTKRIHLKDPKFDGDFSVANQKLADKVESFFQDQLNGRKMKFSDTRLLPENKPSLQRIRELCKSQYFIVAGSKVCEAINGIQ